MLHRYLLPLIGLLPLLWLAGCYPIAPAPAPNAPPPPATELSTTPVLTATTTLTGTAIATGTIAPTSTATLTTTAVPTGTIAPTGTATLTTTAIATTTVTPTSTATLTSTVVPTATESPPPVTPGTPVPTEEPTALPSPSPVPSGTPTGTTTPGPTPTEGPPPTPTPLPQGVFVGEHRSFTKGSSLYVVGEVVNGAPYPVNNVKVIATFFDSADNLLAAQEAMTYLPQTAATQRNPFKLQVANPPANISRYDLALTWDDFSVAEYDRVTVASEQVRNETGVEIYGDLRNDQPSEVRNIVVVATFYDAAGQIVDIFPGSAAATTLAPGAATTYSVATGDPNLQYDHYLVQTSAMLIR